MKSFWTGYPYRTEKRLVVTWQPGEDFGPPRGERHAFLRELCRTKCPPLNVIIMREQLNVKQRQAISETPATLVNDAL
jgi:hypothetical protein